MPTPHDPQRQFAHDVVARLRKAGFEALWAGGCVRDQLRGQVPKDYDVATGATPEQVRDLFGHQRTIPIGVAFGVVTVLGSKDVQPIEVATFRTEGDYTDGRRPDRVEFATAEIDASRRDFTINGLFFDPLTGEVMDYVGGRADLEAGVVRAIGNAADRIGEDKLRMLRAVRFAARFDFVIDRATMNAVRDRNADIAQVSGERIGAELRAMLCDPNRAQAMELLRQTGLETHVFSEITSVVGDDWNDLLAVAARLNRPTLPLVLAALLRGDSDLRVAGGIGGRWKLPNRDVARADWLLEKLPVVLAACGVGWPRLQRVLSHDGAPELLALATAIAGGEDPSVTLCREKLSLPAEQLNPTPLVTGDDLIRHGLAPGPKFGSWLETIRDAQLEGRLQSREEALDMADRLSR